MKGKINGKMIVIICLFIVAIMLIPVFFVVLANLMVLTYGDGFRGLVIRFALLVVILIGLPSSVILWHIVCKKKGEKDRFVINVFVTLVIAIGCFAYFDGIATWKDFQAKPVSKEFSFVIEQRSECHIMCQDSGKLSGFRMSIFERMYDEKGNLVFKPFHSGGKLSLSLYQRVWFSEEYYRGTFTYYPNSKTRIGVENIREV